MACCIDLCCILIAAKHILAAFTIKQSMTIGHRYNDLCRMHLRCRIGKIKELQTGMIEGYGKYYESEKGEPMQEKKKQKLNFYSSTTLNTCVQRYI
jgi:hypothetical protein